MDLVKIVDRCIASLYPFCMNSEFTMKNCKYETNCGYLSHVFSVMMDIDIENEYINGQLYEDGYAYIVIYDQPTKSYCHTYSWFVYNHQIYKLEASEDDFGPTISKITPKELVNQYREHFKPQLSRSKIDINNMKEKFEERKNYYQRDIKIAKFVKSQISSNRGRFLNYVKST